MGLQLPPTLPNKEQAVSIKVPIMAGVVFGFTTQVKAFWVRQLQMFWLGVGGKIEEDN